jgi:hypothetical protein
LALFPDAGGTRVKNWSWLVALLLLPSAASAEGVDWQRQVLAVTGSGPPDMKATHLGQARLGAERAARADALRGLTTAAQAIRIDAATTLGEAMAAPEVRARVERVLEAYEVSATRYFSDGGIEIEVQVPIPALTAALGASGLSGPEAAVVPEGAQKHTGLVVDASALRVLPALKPRLLDADGAVLYGIDSLRPEVQRAEGVAVYVKGLAAAKKHARAGARPLVVKAVKVDGVDLVLAAEDARRVSEAGPAALAAARVVIVTR